MFFKPFMVRGTLIEFSRYFAAPQACLNRYKYLGIVNFGGNTDSRHLSGRLRVTAVESSTSFHKSGINPIKEIFILKRQKLR